MRQVVSIPGRGDPVHLPSACHRENGIRLCLGIPTQSSGRVRQGKQRRRDILMLGAVHLFLHREHEATLGRAVELGDCLIGMNATVLNGAVIGAGSLVAAGAVVLEGTIIPPRSLVAGIPAKVRRELTDDEVAEVTANAENYVELSRKHAAL